MNKDGESGPDAALADAPPGLVCFGTATGLVKPCFPVAPTGDVMLPATINTGTSPLCSTVVTSADSSTNNYCVIAGATFNTDTSVNVTGTKPLVLVAVTTITIGTTLDVASHRSPAKVGPGSDPASCNAGTPPDSSGGGAGGSMIGPGGRGGASVIGAGGTSGAVQTITTLRGGCPGQAGASGNIALGGHGGGAVYLIAEGSIIISAAINASGEGGHSGAGGNGGHGGGGGGGGSGGMIGLDAPLIMNMGSGVVFANGASGAEGGATNAASGIPGLEPISAAPSGSSGGNTASGGDGGAGSAGGTAGGTATGNVGAVGTLVGGLTGGGGGGGGGVGIIKVFRGTLGGAHSPVPTP